MKAIVEIRDTAILFASAVEAGAFLGSTVILSRSGYGSDVVYKKNDKAASLTMVNDEQIRIDNPEAERLEEKLSEKKSELYEAHADTKREKLFWTLRQKAHALGVTDDSLRAQLKRTASYSLSEFELKKD